MWGFLKGMALCLGPRQGMPEASDPTVVLVVAGSPRLLEKFPCHRVA